MFVVKIFPRSGEKWRCSKVVFVDEITTVFEIVET